MAFRREKFVPRGGPSGGDGGKGGSVVLIGDTNRNTLYHLRVPGPYRAGRGAHGQGSDCTGRGGKDLNLAVPLGTQVYDHDSGELLGEVLEEDQRLVVARGGDGGRGNARFSTSTNRAPRRYETGWPGEELTLRLELKLLADVGVIGLPNAGKSTLISSISAARPKVADYPFTTLHPQLGVVDRGQLTDPMVLADLPGLIEGAALGAGLGIRFLKHTERCRVLVHMVDLAPLEDGSATHDLEVIEQELAAYNPDLVKRPRLIVGSKLDSARPERREQLRQAAEERGLAYLEISSVTRDGLETLKHRIGALVDEAPDVEAYVDEAPDIEAYVDENGEGAGGSTAIAGVATSEASDLHETQEPVTQEPVAIEEEAATDPESTVAVVPDPGSE